MVKRTAMGKRVPFIFAMFSTNDRPSYMVTSSSFDASFQLRCKKNSDVQRRPE